MRIFRALFTIGSNNGSSSTIKAGKPHLFRKLFGKYLLVTNTASAGLLMVAGDLAAQEIEIRAKKKPNRIDWTRVGTYLALNIPRDEMNHIVD